MVWQLCWLVDDGNLDPENLTSPHHQRAISSIRDGPESPTSPIAKSPSQNSLRNASLVAKRKNVC
ncbi:hypothetical protein ABKV19_020398 [Rosa sericea]